MPYGVLRRRTAWCYTWWCTRVHRALENEGQSLRMIFWPLSLWPPNWGARQVKIASFLPTSYQNTWLYIFLMLRTAILDECNFKKMGRKFTMTRKQPYCPFGIFFPWNVILCGLNIQIYIRTRKGEWVVMKMWWVKPSIELYWLAIVNLPSTNIIYLIYNARVCGPPR